MKEKYRELKENKTVAVIKSGGRSLQELQELIHQSQTDEKASQSISGTDHKTTDKYLLDFAMRSQRAANIYIYDTVTLSEKNQRKMLRSQNKTCPFTAFTSFLPHFLPFILIDFPHYLEEKEIAKKKWNVD